MFNGFLALLPTYMVQTTATGTMEDCGYYRAAADHSGRSVCVSPFFCHVPVFCCVTFVTSCFTMWTPQTYAFDLSHAWHEIHGLRTHLMNNLHCARRGLHLILARAGPAHVFVDESQACALLA
jgi:hypothetical protein